MSVLVWAKLSAMVISKRQKSLIVWKELSHIRCCRGGSRISGKGVHTYKGVCVGGGSLC